MGIPSKMRSANVLRVSSRMAATSGSEPMPPRISATYALPCRSTKARYVPSPRRSRSSGVPGRTIVVSSRSRFAACSSAAT